MEAALQSNQVIDEKYQVLGVCSDEGGMGRLLFVKRLGVDGESLVLKSCRHTEPDMLDRFRREVRLMQEFSGDDHVVPVLDANLAHSPPYFVMPYYSDGDLRQNSTRMRGDLAKTEKIIYRMIDCIARLHARSVIHRDIKPQNFLLDRNRLMVSDFGLCTDQDSGTGVTGTAQHGGTPGYMPPEFKIPGGFKNASPASDIYMLGKSFYEIMSGEAPQSFRRGAVPPQMFAIIERCCDTEPSRRYQSLAQLKQSVQSAFDVLLDRAKGPARAYALLREIMDRARTQRQFERIRVALFVDELELQEPLDQAKLCKELAPEFFHIIAHRECEGLVSRFLVCYQGMARGGDYGWSFAEVIANNMKIVFDSDAPGPESKCKCLEISIESAIAQNRFAAMDTCAAMVVAIEEPELAQRAHDLILQIDAPFLRAISPHDCKALSVRMAVNMLHESERARKSRRADGENTMW